MPGQTPVQAIKYMTLADKNKKNAYTDKKNKIGHTNHMHQPILT
jgi:hypothetical protein